MTTLEKVIAVVSRETGAENLQESTFLDSLGLDSLEFLSLMQAIEKDIAPIPDVEWIGLNTVHSIVQACERHL